ncbi:hypothetical protein OG352_22485 [Streptomyces sp. NBC_01485]|uniref:hypothetical protein n=1 Tax=Streptomyces sp. NBC_01485 TaxID=2903884 RepID=UPI002E37E7F5|nr:hypothetical protein [Streptomyces sp. NBC_01485]
MNAQELNAQERAGRVARIGKRHRDPDGRVGILSDVLRGTAYLRPECGGREWTVPVENVEPVADNAQDAERLRVKVAEANRRSRGER